MSTTRGSGAPGSSRKGRTAEAPGWRIISSVPVEPSGKRTVSMSRSRTLPEWTRREERRGMGQYRRRTGARALGRVRVPLRYASAYVLRCARAPVRQSVHRIALGIQHGNRSELERFDAAPDLGEIPHDDHAELLGLEVLLRHARHVRRLHGLDLLQVPAELGLGESIESELSELKRDAAVRLDGPGIGADQRALRELDLLLRDRPPLADLLELAHEFDERAVGLGREDSAAGHEGPLAAHEHPAAARAVGESARLAK